MVESLPPEFEAGRDVHDVYWPLLTELVAAAGGSPGPSATTVLDLCCGSGRVALGLAGKWAAWDGRPAGAALALTGVDSSEEMLAAARAKQAAQAGSPGPGSCSSSGGSSGNSEAGAASISWRCADMAALDSASALAPLRGRCSLAVVSAGSFHHLLTAADQGACLRGLAACLQQPPAPAYVVLNIFCPSHLQAAPGGALVAGAFRRTCLSQSREQAADGGSVWRQRFALERYASAAAAAAAAGGSSEGVRSEAPLWRRDEEWALREVSPAELEQRAGAAGLRVVRRQAHWSDGWPGADGGSQGSDSGCSLEDARIFVLRLAA